jgi:hypothetical protein
MSDDFRIPDRMLGPIDDELATRIGQVAMLASVLETQLAGIASNLGEKMQAAYASESGSSSIDFIRKRLGRPGRSPDEAAVAREIEPYLDAASSLLAKRNSVVHRVWVKANGDGVWSGWMPDRQQRTSPIDWVRWEIWTRLDLDEVLEGLLASIVSIWDRRCFLERSIMQICVTVTINCS